MYQMSDINSYTKDELLAKCKELKIKGIRSKTKGDLLHLLQNTLSQSQSLQQHTITPFKFIDLFCGIGGFHQAMKVLGGSCVYACDIDPKCREVYELNYSFKPDADITKVNPETIPDFDILCGGFPCQAFSHAGKQDGFEDTRGTLFRDIIRILNTKKPKYFLLENVKNLKGHDEGRTWNTIYSSLIEAGYETYNEPIVMSPHFLGVPQHRERVLILGWRKDCLPNGCLPNVPTYEKKASNIRTILEDSPSNIKGLQITKSDEVLLEHWEKFVKHFKELGVKLPTFPLWSDWWDSVENIKELPLWKQKFIRQNREFYTQYKVWLEGWLQEARAIPSFLGAKRKFEWQCGAFQPNDSIWTLLFQYRPSGIRVKRANYSPALVAMAQIVYVGEKKRKLSPREVARLQSFPDSFILPESTSVVYKQFGNSVNVDVIIWAARHILMTTQV